MWLRAGVLGFVREVQHGRTTQAPPDVHETVASELPCNAERECEFYCFEVAAQVDIPATQLEFGPLSMVALWRA